MNAPIDWVSAVAILAAGLIIGAIVFFAIRRKPSTLDTNLDRKDLEAKRDALIAQLRALPDDAVDERARLERETAVVLRALDVAPLPASRGEGGPERSEGPGEGPSSKPSTANPALKGFLWGAGSFAALAALLYFVMQSSTPREQQQQAAPMAAQQPSNPATQQPDPQLRQLEAAVQTNPDNLALRNDLAQAYLERDNLMAVFDQTKYVLAKSPNDSRALTFQALVRVAMGETDLAIRLLRQAIQSDAKNLDAHVALAWVYSQNANMAAADAAIAEAIKASPNDKAKLEDVLRRMKAMAAQTAQQAQVATGAPLPEGHPPVNSAEPSVPAGHPPVNAEPTNAAPAGPSVRVTLNLATAAPPRGVLFVIARNPAGGPPAAVKRVPVTSFPITIDLSQADSMMGQPLPDHFRLEARLDSDGDPLTKPPSDPSAALDNVAPGAVVTLALK